MIKWPGRIGFAIPGPSGKLGKRRHGLLQVSCALLLERNESSGRFESNQITHTTKLIGKRVEGLTEWFAPQPGPYQLVALAKEPGASTAGQASGWLDPMSRHGSYDMARYKGYEGANPGVTIPALFAGARELTYSGKPKPRPRIPVQRSEDKKQKPQYTRVLDYNDFLVKISDSDSSVPKSLVDAQRFLAFLYALRRSVIFASSLRERIYNIWLPPAILTPSCEQDTGFGKIAIFPLVGLTRRPNSQAWRYVFTFSLVIAPISSDESGARKISDAELGAIVGCLDGPSMNPIRRQYDIPRYQMDSRAWNRYASHLLGQAPVCELPHASTARDGTLRNWIELLFFAVARRQLVQPAGRGKWKDAHDKQLADEVLRSIRTTSCWSVLLDAPQRMRPASSVARSPSDTESWSPRSGLKGLMKCFDHLSIANGRWFRPSDEDRVDHGRVGERTWMAWAHPVRRCVVTFHFSRAENFPLRSRLNLFAVFGHMIGGLMTAREILVKLGHDFELHRESQEAAELRRKYVIELEEIFDLDIAWTLYRKMYQRLRNLRGLDEMYRNVRERTDVLGRHDTTLDEIKTEKRRTRLSVAAAILATTIIVLGVWTSKSQMWQRIVFAALMLVGAVVWGNWGRWRELWKHLLKKLNGRLP
jgi:hypothetical protein